MRIIKLLTYILSAYVCFNEALQATRMTTAPLLLGAIGLSASAVWQLWHAVEESVARDNQAATKALTGE